jgi:hypothetical protein
MTYPLDGKLEKPLGKKNPETRPWLKRKKLCLLRSLDLLPFKLSSVVHP